MTRSQESGRRSGAMPAVLGLLAATVLAGPAAGQAQVDLCGCADHPQSLGDFDTKNQETWPPGTTVERNRMEIPLPPDGVLVFKSFIAEKWTNDTDRIYFKRNANNTPVTILIAGDFSTVPYLDLVLNGAHGGGGNVSINGRGGAPGPGGFRGGEGAYFDINGGNLGGEGLGPRGGKPGSADPLENGGVGEFGGSRDLLPLVGGSGGGGGASVATGNCSAGGGGGGGGALLLVANGSVTVNGGIYADGGRGGGRSNGECASYGGNGSGGAIRIVAREAGGTGYVTARSGGRDRGAGPGVVRVETLTEDTFRPNNLRPPAVRTRVIGPLTNPIPTTVRIASIGGQSLPEIVNGVVGAVDLVLPAPGEITVEVHTTGVPAGTTVEVAMKPQVDGEARRNSGELSASSCTPTGECKAFVTFELPSGAYFAEAVATFRTP